MLRALGMRQKTLIQILVTKSFVFSVPGIAVGLFVSFIANIPVAQLVAAYANIDPVYSFIGSALISSVLVGLIMPIIANILPISRALSRTLRDSLDVYHHVISDVTVRVIKVRTAPFVRHHYCLSILSPTCYLSIVG
jgi:predicted lysophospholipase L1 biosynthesis ABC-type transport system permease subunit